MSRASGGAGSGAASSGVDGGGAGEGARDRAAGSPGGPWSKGLPSLVVMDLDDTVWYPEMYMLRGAPFRKDSGRILDRAGEEVHLYGGVAAAVALCVREGVKLGWASRTEHGDWANDCLRLFTIEDVDKRTLHDLGDYSEIFPGDKKRHFRNIATASGIPYERMLFFDNERRNCTSVATLGVVTFWCPDGLDARAWGMGLKKFKETAEGKPPSL